MKIAIVSDIHSNIEALKAVLKDINQRRCDVILCLGDLIGYYYWPEEVVNLLMNTPNVFAIKGNHEEMYLKSLSDLNYKEWVNKKYGAGINYACDDISNDSLSYLRSLKSSLDLTLDGKNIGAFHGSPFSIDQYLYPDLDHDSLLSVTNNKFDVVLFGHTHHQFISCFNKTLIINPGSVGQARDVRGLAAYAIYNTKSETVVPVRVKYNTKSLIDAIKKIEKNQKKMLTAVKGFE